jgi:hypothetical protein
MGSASMILSRWLRLGVAALALLAGSGVHEALHASHGPGDARPAAPFEAHGSDCEHRESMPHDGSACVLCKVGRLHAATEHVEATQIAPPRNNGRHAHGATHRVASLQVPGALGARAPPVTVG